MFGLIAWIILGAIAGWIASLITGRNAQMGCLANVIVGVLGALVGGFLVDLVLPGDQAVGGLNVYSIIVATLGAVLLLSIFGWYRRRV